MEYDNEAIDAKRSEIRTLILEAIPTSLPYPERVAESVIDGFVSLTPPSIRPMAFEMITLRSAGLGGGESWKPGNIILNWRKLMDLVPELTITTAMQ